MKKILFLLLAVICSLFVACTDKMPENATFDGKRLIINDSTDVYEVSALNDDIIKVACKNKNHYSDRVYAPVLQQPVKAKCRNKDGKLTFSVGNAAVVIDVNTMDMFFVDDEKEIKLAASDCFDIYGDTCLLRFKLSPEEEIYGTGARALPLNRRGYKFQCYNQPNYGYGLGADFLNYSVPVFMSSKKYMMLIDNPARAYFDIGKTNPDILEFGSRGGNMVFYYIEGDDYKELLKNYITLTGAQPLPPIWAFGNLQSRFGYRSQAETEGVVDIMKVLGYPIDAIIIDIYWFGPELQDGMMGNFTWDKENWPAPEKMIEKFKNKGVKTITVSEPYITRKSFRYEEASNLGVLCKDSTGQTMSIPYFYFGDGGLIDIFDKKASDWFWQLYKAQKELGVAGWWGDLGEPEVHPDDMWHINGTAYEVHGAYGDGWIKMLYDNYAKDYPDERLFKLARAGYAGTQKYGIMPWTGDVGRTWEGLKAQPPAMLGSGMSGVGYMHSDAGGFAQGKRDSALYTRWMQYAVFTPVFRPHGDIATAPNEPIFYDDRTQFIVKNFIKLRYKMLPYNYTNAFVNMTEGMPLARPLLFYYETDTVARNIYDEYMWGNDILVAPKMQDTSTLHLVYLPEKGTEWFELLSMRRFPGGQRHSISYKLSDYPAFVRGGAVIPMYEKPIFTTDTYSPDTIALYCYYSDKACDYKTFVYFDDGKTKDAYAKGLYAILDIQSKYTPTSIEISTSYRSNDLSDEFVSPKVVEMVVKNIASKPLKLLINGKETTCYVWDGKSHEMRFFCNAESNMVVNL